MQFWDSKDESAIGLMAVGFGIVVMAAILGNVTGNVQPKAPFEVTHPDVSSPYLRENVQSEPVNPATTSPYHQPQPEKK